MRKELLEKNDYQRLYDEILDFQIRYHHHGKCPSKEKYEDTRRTIEFVTEFFYKFKEKDYEPFDFETVSQFLGYRKLVWALARCEKEKINGGVHKKNPLFCFFEKMNGIFKKCEKTIDKM